MTLGQAAALPDMRSLRTEFNWRASSSEGFSTLVAMGEAEARAMRVRATVMNCIVASVCVVVLMLGWAGAGLGLEDGFFIHFQEDKDAARYI